MARFFLETAVDALLVKGQELRCFDSVVKTRAAA